MKLKQVLGRIRLLKSQIIFLQESHLTDTIKVKKRWPGQVFAAPFNSQARGVIILIHKSIPFRLSREVIDLAGRYIILQGTILEAKLPWSIFMDLMRTITLFLGTYFSLYLLLLDSIL